MKKKLNFKQNHYGVEKRQEWADLIHAQSGFLPQGINIKDIDQEFISMVKNELSPICEFIHGGEVKKDKVPVFFLTSQRWAEFSKTWEFTNEMKDLSLPFITIVRTSDIQVGTMYDGFYNIPGRRNWTYMKVPNTTNDMDGVDLYKIPQPTPIDLTFEVKFFSNKISEINTFSENFHKNYNALQKYIIVKGHPISTKNESVSDESVLDLEERKMFITSCEILVKGFILDENDFEVVSSINRITNIIEIDNKNGKKTK